MRPLRYLGCVVSFVLHELCFFSQIKIGGGLRLLSPSETQNNDDKKRLGNAGLQQRASGSPLFISTREWNHYLDASNGG